jgi:non-ribosomal peptide synthase protein (TIGR01720 family)
MADVRKVSGTLDRDSTAFLLKDAHRIYKTDVPVLLNVALAMALKEWTGQTSLLVEQENHGRHLSDPDTSRTIGWFTVMYPVRLTIVDSTIGDQIMAIKEQLRKVPEYGMGYGLRDKTGNKLTGIRFNYLGQFGDELDNDLFTYSDLPTGPDVSPANAMTAKIELNAMIRDGELKIELSYNATAHKEATIEQFAAGIFYHLNKVLDHLQAARDIHFTPSDFDAVDLNDEELNALFG